MHSTAASNNSCVTVELRRGLELIHFHKRSWHNQQKYKSIVIVCNSNTVIHWHFAKLYLSSSTAGALWLVNFKSYSIQRGATVVAQAEVLGLQLVLTVFVPASVDQV